jgi:hypothetical protein
MGVVLETSEREIYEHSLAAAKAALGDDGFNAAFDTGQKMTLEDAIQWALEG